MKILTSWIVAVVILSANAVFAGAVFVTGHDPVWHSHFGGNSAGATTLANTMIDFARDGSALPFLYVESKTVPVPGGNAHEAPFLTPDLGYAASEYDVFDAADLLALADFRTTLDSYSAIVVASDHGGMLSAAELAFLNDHAADILDYINDGGGLAASAESNATGLIGSTPRFGFLPFLVSSSDLQDAESGNTVTPFGAGLGLVDSDVNGNFSHNIFTATGGMEPVDLRNGDPNQILSLAFKGTLSTGGVIPEPATGLVLLFGVGAAAAMRRRKNSKQNND